jgi:hypothetical protein
MGVEDPPTRRRCMDKAAHPRGSVTADGDRCRCPLCHERNHRLVTGLGVIPDFASKIKCSSHVCPGSFIPHTWT